jgi:HSP20 family protein
MRKMNHHHADGRLSSRELSHREKVLAVDVKADEEAYTIAALLPGMDADDIKVEILDKTVSIRGEFQGDESDEFMVSELPVGRFSRVLTLPTALDSSKAEANLKNGVFTLHVPKSEADRPKLISISAE